MLFFCGVAVAAWGQAKGYRETYAGYIWKNGQLLQVQNGKPKALNKPVKLKNGNVLHPAGYFVLVNGEQGKLREGESMDSNGDVLYPEYQADGSISFLSHQPARAGKNKNIPAPQPPANIRLKKPKN
jgi:hypothetical protein